MDGNDRAPFAALHADEAGDRAVDEAALDARAECERSWLLRTRDGDSEAFALLVEAYRAPVYSYLGRCGIDARERDDLFQDIFLKIYRASASYDAERPVHPWIFTIVCNTARTFLRRRRLRQLVFGGRDRADADGQPAIDDPVDHAPDSERRALARQRLGLLERELTRLSAVQRDVVVLACVEKRRLAEVGEALGLPVNTVKTHLRRARLALARALTRHDRVDAAAATEARS